MAKQLYTSDNVGSVKLLRRYDETKEGIDRDIDGERFRC